MGSYNRPDAVIAGAGVAGLAAGICLARRGLRVVCIDPDPPPRVRVGESLDWSAPALLKMIGMSRDDLVANGVGTLKLEVRATTPAGDLMFGRPWAWLRRWPLNFELTTLHVNRNQFDLLMWKQAVSAGVEFVADHVVDVEYDGGRIASLVTRSGEHFRAAWFIDASGRRRLIGRSAKIECEEWGTLRMALWTHYTASLDFEGTMLHFDNSGENFTWAWEIPIAKDRRSVGVVVPLDRFQSQKREGQSADEILVEHLARLSSSPGTRFDGLQPVRTRSYRPYVSKRLTGENWAMIGEAAAFADPLTSNGVTAALRHATEIATIITGHRDTPERTTARLRRFDKRSRKLAGISNKGIESLMYESRLRQNLGMRWAARAYVPLGYFTTTLYSRIHPTTQPRMAAFAPLGWLGTVWTRAWLALAAIAKPRHNLQRP